MAVVNTNLKVTFDVCEAPNCRYITIRDTTGVYNSITNTGGWDSTEVANPSASNVTAVNVIIVSPAGVTTTFDTESIPNPLDYLPDTNKLLEFPISYADLGGATGSKFLDGIYEITVKYYGDFGSDTYTAENTCEILLTCQTNCCLDKLSKEIAKSQCLDCKKESIAKLEEAKRYLTAAKNAVACGMSNLGKINLAAAQWYCNDRNCASCFK